MLPSNNLGFCWALSRRENRPLVQTMSDLKNSSSARGSAPDLQTERELLLQSFHQGAALTERLMSEYARLKERVLEVEEENARLRAQLLADDRVARLLEQVERLERDRAELLSRTKQAEELRGSLSERAIEIESEFAHFANLYVAGNQLHASLTLQGVWQRLRDILGQLIGAASYALYLRSEDGARLLFVGGEGFPHDIPRELAIEGSKVGGVVSAGIAKIDEDGTSTAAGEPRAIIPLTLADKAIGAFVIHRLLEQKLRFSRTDFELFKLLGQHAGPALVGAFLFESGGHKLPSAEALLSAGF